MLTKLRRTIAPALALTLCLTVVTQSAYAQQWCPPEPRKKTASARSAASRTPPAPGEPTAYRVRNVRTLSAVDAARTIRASTRRDIIILPTGLLTQEAIIAALKESKAMFAVLDGPGSATIPAQLNQRITGVQLFAGAPTNEAGIRRVYRDESVVTPQSVRQAARIGKTLANMQEATLLTNNSATTVLREARRGDTSTLLLVLAHSENGTLYFPDGTSLALKAVNEALRTSKRPGLIISCETIDQQHSGITTAKRIDFEAAATAINAARNATSLGAFVDTFARTYRSPREQVRQQVVVIGSSSVAVLILILILLGDDDD